MRYKNVCCARPPYQPASHFAAPTAMPKFMHFRTVKNEQRGRMEERGNIFCFWENNYLNKAPKKKRKRKMKKLRGAQRATKRLSYVQNKSRMLTKCWPNMQVRVCGTLPPPICPSAWQKVFNEFA